MTRSEVKQLVGDTHTCPVCGNLVSIRDFDTGQLRDDKLVVEWVCSHCKTYGSDEYEKMRTEWHKGHISLGDDADD